MSKTLKPQIRFNGYEDEWQQAKVREVFILGNGYTPSKAIASYWTNGTIPWFRMEDIRENGRVLADAIQHVTPSAVKSSGLFPAGSIIVSTTATIGEHALLIADSLANQQFTVFQTVNRWSWLKANYLLYRFYGLGDWCRRNVNAGGLAAVNISDLQKYDIDFPKEESERDSIAEYFSNLDTQIKEAEREIDRLEKMKIASLQKMFPRPGATVPEIRFAGFSEPWKEYMIGDICTTYSGGTPSANNSDFYGGNIPFIRSGEIHGNTTELFLTDKGLANSSATLVTKGIILYALYGATSGEAAICRIDGAINQAILAIIPNPKFNSLCICYWFKHNKNSIINTYLQGGQGNLSETLVKSIRIVLPSLGEQRAIGEYFRNLDELIAAKRKSIVKLRNIKKACLSKMFVNNTEL